MKVLTILGTRPEIIRLSVLVERLDAGADHVLVHTGQNADDSLSARFFAELGVRAPDHHLGLGPAPELSLGARLGRVLTGVGDVLASERPDRVVVLGDTDSALGALVAKRMGIPVVHLEAGNRCFDDRVPEEVNRRVIDHASDVLDRLGLQSGAYALATCHRQENVDDPHRLAQLARALDLVGGSLDVPIVMSVHPRTADRLRAAGLDLDDRRVRACPPFGFTDFVALEAGACLVLTDSGTVQEECCLLDVPSVTVRDTTERPETVECGSNVVSGVAPADVLAAARLQLGRRGWTPPPEYLVPDASAVAAAVALGPLPGRRPSA